VLKRDVAQENTLVMYDVTEPIKAKRNRWRVGEESWLENVDFRNFRIPLLMLVFAMTAYYQLVYKKKPESNFGDDIVEKIEASVGRRLDDKIGGELRKSGGFNRR
jgi:hypothetical protein